MSDPRTYTIPTEQDIDCESCSWTNTATDWTNIHTGEWSYEFTCTSCGRLNAAHGNALDRGSTSALASVVWLGVILIVAALVSLFIVPAHPAHLALILTGTGLIVSVLTIATIAWLKQNGHDHV